MQISKHILNIPPYISTPWKNVSSLLVDHVATGPVLKIVLTSGIMISIPQLDQATLTTIFNFHALYLETEHQATTPPPQKGAQFGFQIPLGMDPSIANIGSMMQHNPEHMNAPPIPQEVLEKVSAMAKAVGIDTDMFPKPEPHCNCPHCQMARAIHKLPLEQKGSEPTEEEVSEEDLRFRDWEIKQTGDKLHRVTNPLNAEEHFDVYLGSPIGCTCGEKDCEHIRAVLRS